MPMNDKTVNLFSRWTWIAIAVIGVIGLIFLLKSHTSHALAVAPYLILLLCPFMHIFMHKGHGGHDKEDHGEHHKS